MKEGQVSAHRAAVVLPTVPFLPCKTASATVSFWGIPSDARACAVAAKDRGR